METHSVKNVAQLVDIVGAGNINSKLQGPKVVEVTLWDGRIITGSYYKGERNPDIMSQELAIFDDDMLGSFIDRLLISGESFITETGSDDLVCTLIWEVQIKSR